MSQGTVMRKSSSELRSDALGLPLAKKTRTSNAMPRQQEMFGQMAN